MKQVLQVLLFYILCCFGNMLFQLSTIEFPSEDPASLYQFRYGLNMMIIYVFFLYSPLCTFLVSIYKFTKINERVIRHPFLYSLSPFIIPRLIMCVSDIGTLRDNLIITIFVTENIIIVGWSCWQYYKKNRTKQLHEEWTEK